MFTKVLVANRSEIAVRVISTCRRLGIGTVAIHSAAEPDAAHVALADEAVCVGPAPAVASYLDHSAVLAAALAHGCDAIHPGYGFLSENPEFARAVTEAGLAFIGPPARAIATMGDKIAARAAVSARGVPLVPGISEVGLSIAELAHRGPALGFPLLIKPAAGGGGKGMHVVEREVDLAGALATAEREARAAFGDGTLFLEHLVPRPRHVEVQVLADEHGQVVSLGERECSLQRRHQKIVEETPSVLCTADLRERMGTAAIEAARSVDYRGAGTVEFIVDGAHPEDFAFMEMNTRLQVEHPVTEMVTGLDLVEWQLRIAAGEPLDDTVRGVRPSGHAIEARIYAEDPDHGFLPTGGRVLDLLVPRGEGIRVDAGVRAGQRVVSDYDPMLAKVVAHGADRDQALARLRHALRDFALPGVVTNTDFLLDLLARPDVMAGELDTELVDRIPPGDIRHDPDHLDTLFATAALTLTSGAAGTGFTGPIPPPDADAGAWDRADGWRLSGAAPTTARLQGPHGELEASYRHEPVTVGPHGLMTLRIEETLHRAHVWSEAAERAVWVCSERGTTRFRLPDTARPAATDLAGTEVRSPMPGTLAEVRVAVGDHVEAGTPVAVLEAMKMEHVLRAPASGSVTRVLAVGRQLTAEETVATIEPDTGGPDTSEPGSVPGPDAPRRHA